jgi:hypothetical protein
VDGGPAGGERFGVVRPPGLVAVLPVAAAWTASGTAASRACCTAADASGATVAACAGSRPASCRERISRESDSAASRVSAVQVR